MGEQVGQILERVLRETNAWVNPYFVALRDSSFEKDDFVETQIQFYFAVVFFSRPMAVVAAKIPSPELRLEVMRNVWEEHGEGEVAKIHGQTFRELLHRLDGLDSAAIEARALWPEVRSFNTTLTGCSVSDDWEVGTACFGTIERMFVEISQWIGAAIVERGWLSAERLVHYNLHEELDVKHADDFFAVLRAGTDDSPEAIYRIEQGVRMGAYIFDGLYRGLFVARRRRLSQGFTNALSRTHRP